MEIETNERGGKQSKIYGKATELPPLALLEVSKVMALGLANYPREEDGTPNWYRISATSNLDHALEHAFNFLGARNVAEQDAEEMIVELSHFAARALMALEQFIRGDL
jgi:hypothetical protein